MISEGSTVLIEGAGTADDVRARLGQIRVELERATQETDIEVLRERLAKLASSLAVIAQPGAVIAPGFGDLAEGSPGRRHPSSCPVRAPATG